MMVESIDKLLGGIVAELRRRILPNAVQPPLDPALEVALEQAIESTDPRIRLVSGYRKKLLVGVQTAHDYVRQLVQGIPSAIEISQKNFTNNPYVNAFFANTDELRTVFSRSPEMRDFLDDSANRRLQESCALLCMRKSEKTCLGMELSGDMVKRDVLQTAVNFTDHHVLSPSQSEADARKGLQCCFYEGLLTNALQQISSQRYRRKLLESRRSELSAELRHLQAFVRRAGVDPLQAARKGREISVLEGKLKKVEAELSGIPVMTPETSLETVCAVLADPESHIQVQHEYLKVDKLGLKTENDRKPHNDLDLTEVCIDGQEPRMVVLARFPLSEILPVQPMHLV